MSRLLRCSESGRADLVVHLALGASAVAAAVICLCATFDFVSGLDRIAERLAGPPARTIFAAPVGEPGNSPTNIADLELGPVGTGAPTQSDPAAGKPTEGRMTDLPTG